MPDQTYTILIVEDSATMRYAYSQVLEDRYNLIFADNPLSALTEVATNRQRLAESWSCTKNGKRRLAGHSVFKRDFNSGPFRRMFIRMSTIFSTSSSETCAPDGSLIVLMLVVFIKNNFRFVSCEWPKKLGKSPNRVE